MNEPTEHAQSIIGSKTTAKALLNVLKGCDSASLHGNAALNRASYSDSFVFEVSAKFEGRTKSGGRVIRNGTETFKSVEVPGWVSNGHTDEKEMRTSAEGRFYPRYTGVHKPMKGFWWLYARTDRIIDILELLPKDAEIAFHVYLDAGTNEPCVDANMHADHLYLCAKYTNRGKRVERTFLIDATTGRHNSARFGT